MATDGARSYNPSILINRYFDYDCAGSSCGARRRRIIRFRQIQGFAVQDSAGNLF
jgi:hypothetical protein